MSMAKAVAEGRAGMPAASAEDRGGTPTVRTGAPNAGAATENSHPEQQMLMEAVVGRENMLAAFQRVRANKGAPGVDGMRVENVWGYCTLHWSRIREDLLDGRYKPQPVLGVEIPKPGGGGASIGHPDGPGSSYPASIAPDSCPHFQPRILKLQLRLPPRSKRASGRATSTRACRHRQAVGRGYRFGEIFSTA